MGFGSVGDVEGCVMSDGWGGKGGLGGIRGHTCEKGRRNGNGAS